MKLNQIIKIIFLLILSFALPLWINESELNRLVEEIVFSASSIMVGLTIALIGILFSNINDIYLALLKIFQTDKSINENTKQNALTRVTNIKRELKENMTFVIISFSAIIVLILLKEADLPYIHWFIDSQKISKNYIINSSVLFLNALMVLAIYDTVMGAFKMSSALEITKQ